MSTYDDETPLEFFDEPETLEAPARERRRMRPRRPGGPRRPAPPPHGAVALARLAGLVALAIAVVVGLVFWVGSCQGKSTHDEYKSYMDDVRPIAQSSAGTGTALVNALPSEKLTLTKLHSDLEQWSREQQLLYDEASRLRPPAAIQAENQQVLATLQLRAIGLTGLADALAGAGSKSASKVGQLLARQARLLQASDLVWSQLFRVPATQTMTRLGVKGVIAPPSRIITNPEVITADSLGRVYGRLQVVNTSKNPAPGLHGSELLGTEAVSGGSTKPLTAGPTTVNVAANLVFKVSLRNAGNFDEANVPVTLTVTVGAVSSTKPVYAKTQHVLSLPKGATQAVEFGNLQLPTHAFGANAIVHVEVGKVPGEQNVANNRASYPVFFSLPSNG
jgi:hypothetical protein